VPLARRLLAVALVLSFLDVGRFLVPFIPFVRPFSPGTPPASTGIVFLSDGSPALPAGRRAAYSIVRPVPVLDRYLVVLMAVGGSPASCGGLKG
jgi:hypothetical protein